MPVPNHLRPLVLGNGNSIQPVEPGADFAREAEPVERLAADIELVSRLMWAQYQGREWHIFQAALAQYGVAVLVKWMLSGRIFIECKRKGFGELPRWRRRDRDDAIGISGETVARALLFFRERVLLPGLWDPARGASVRTYFIGACIRHFPNEYHRSLGSERLASRYSVSDEANAMQSLPDHRRFLRPDMRAELASDFRAIQDPQTREIVLLTAQGASQQEIAHTLKTTRKSVEAKLYRLHERVR
jgi:DNA-directed RNA polymerase specialized sigma24 family protein